MPSTTTGGVPAMRLKNENGAALTRPAVSTVVTQAIGRGTISDDSRLYRGFTSMASMSNSMSVS